MRKKQLQKQIIELELANSRLMCELAEKNSQWYNMATGVYGLLNAFDMEPCAKCLGVGFTWEINSYCATRTKRTCLECMGHGFDHHALTLKNIKKGCGGLYMRMFEAICAEQDRIYREVFNEQR